MRTTNHAIAKLSVEIAARRLAVERRNRIYRRRNVLAAFLVAFVISSVWIIFIFIFLFILINFL